VNYLLVVKGKTGAPGSVSVQEKWGILRTRSLVLSLVSSFVVSILIEISPARYVTSGNVVSRLAGCGGRVRNTWEVPLIVVLAVVISFKTRDTFPPLALSTASRMAWRAFNVARRELQYTVNHSEIQRRYACRVQGDTHDVLCRSRIGYKGTYWARR
jgi:hypothetical protein